jgi:ADP-ribosylglycohydrolase
MLLAGTALFLIKHCEIAFNGLFHAISIGGDVGTLAPVVVSVLGIYSGLDSLPNSLIEKVENKELIEAYKDKFYEYLVKKFDY